MREKEKGGGEVGKGSGRCKDIGAGMEGSEQREEEEKEDK